jgi:beta-glucosidase
MKYLYIGILCASILIHPNELQSQSKKNVSPATNAPFMGGVDISTLKPISESENALKNAVYADKTKCASERALDLIRRLTFEEKLALSGGWNRFLTSGVERLGIRPVSMADASQGVRLQTALVKEKSTSFPGMLPLASTWNTSLAEKFGKSIGEECRALGVDILLGPGVNMQRLSVGGRNFEYMGEDPFLTSHVATSYIKGLQNQGIIAVAKHFMGNDQDFCRHISSSNMDERTLHEIYLLPWESIIKEAGCKGIMTGNNLVNGIPCSMNKLLIADILRKDFGFTGIAMTDWQNTSYYPQLQYLVLPSGETLLMPDNSTFAKYIDEQVAISSERKSEIELMLEKMIYPTLYTLFETGIYDRSFNDREYFKTFEAHTQLAQKCAEEAIVLLKNEKSILPIPLSKQILLIGEDELHSGTGSGFVTGYGHITYEDGLKAVYGNKLTRVVKPDDKIIQKADVVLFSLNKSAGEGKDIPFEEPADQLDYLRHVTKLNKNVVVLINACNAMPMDWLKDVKGVLWCYFLGQERGAAIANVISGKVNPSGKLPFTIEKKFEDSPDPQFNYIGGKPYWGGNNQYKSYWMGGKDIVIDNFSQFVKPGEIINVPYKEGIFMGYRWYDKNKIPVVFPFGFGQSYTHFEYKNIKYDNRLNTEGKVYVEVVVTNTGAKDGSEVVQLYVSEIKCSVPRPEKELKSFTKVDLKAGESKTVSMVLDRRSFAFWDINKHGWSIESGDFEIKVGGASNNLPLNAKIVIDNASDE